MPSETDTLDLLSLRARGSGLPVNGAHFRAARALILPSPDRFALGPISAQAIDAPTGCYGQARDLAGEPDQRLAA